MYHRLVSVQRSSLQRLPQNARIMSVYNNNKSDLSAGTKPAVHQTKRASNSSAAIIRPWDTPVVESHGDYREEAFLERHIGGPLYEHQDSLPRLPIPSIEETLDRLLPTALPLAKNQQEKDSLLEACSKFPEQARVLQERLQERQKEMHDSSWLQLWWNTAGYLQVRDPVTINVSYFFHFSDDPTLPSQENRNIARGAACMTAVAEYRHKVVSGSLPADYVGKGDRKKYLCATAYKYMFHACRIPHRNHDTYKIYDPSRHTHCIVARKGHFFSVDFMNEMGTPLPLPVLEERLSQCVQLADRSEPPVHLGWLTSQDRDSWADAREELLKVGGAPMEEALETLQSGVFLLCLDDEEPVSRKQCGELFLHGGTSGYNRWFDKSIEIIVPNNGKAGLCGEHSMMDGMPMVGFADHITATTYAKASKVPSAASGGTGGVRNIFENVYPSLQTSTVATFVEEAKQHHVQFVTDHELDPQSFQGYGSSFIKKAGYSPDAYVQMAMQLATYRLFGEQAGTYEATQVRPFLHGRTETTRSVSSASEAFVKRMGLTPKYDEHDASVRQEKLFLLQDAVTSHIKYIGSAAQANGVDRHLFGLSMLVQEGETAPELYSHPLFVRSKRWRVSTSHLTHPKFENWGYGEVVPDGVGLSYSILPDSCVFNITALKEHGWTDRLSHLLEEALLEMRSMIELEKPLQSKL